MPVSFELSGSTALVTGAAGDIGRAVALRLSAAGANVVLTDLTETSDRLEASTELCSEVQGSGAVIAVTADVTDPASVEAAFSAATDRFGAPDLLFNNAGYQGAFVPAPDYPGEDFARVMSVNVTGVFNVLRECSVRLRAEGRPGSIVNSASMAGVDGCAEHDGL